MDFLFIVVFTFSGKKIGRKYRNYSGLETKSFLQIANARTREVGGDAVQPADHDLGSHGDARCRRSENVSILTFRKFFIFNMVHTRGIGNHSVAN